MSLSFNFNPSFSTPTSTTNPFAPATTSSTTSTTTFGAPSTTPSLFSVPAPATTSTPSLFGTTTTATTTPSLFGTTAPSSSAATTTSTFPSFSTPSLSTPSLTTPPSLSTPTLGSTTTPSLFGTSTLPTSSTPTLTTGSTSTTTPFFSSTANPFASSATSFSTPIANVPSSTSTLGATVSAQNVIGSTKYSELPADIQAHLEKFNKLIIDQKVVAEELSRRTADNIPQIKDNATSLIEKVGALTNVIEVDSKAIFTFKGEVLNDVRTVESAYNDSYRLRSPNQFSNTVVLPPKFFWDLVESFDGKLRQYSATIVDIESYLNSLNTKKAADPRTLGESIKAQYDIFVAVAERLAVVHDALEDRKEDFREYRRKYLGDSSNPFEPKKKSVLAPFPVQVTPVPTTPTASTAKPAATPSTPLSFFSPSGTTTAGAGTALFGSSSASTPISFASPATTPSSTLTFGATSPAPAASTFSFATPATTTLFPATTPSTTTPFGASTAASPFGSTSSIGSTSSFGSGASSAFGSTASSSFGGSIASPFGSTASAAAAATAANSQKKNTLSTSQSRNSGRKKSSGSRSS